jgi:ATP-dependent Clp protease ATP-binding subunit ClpC
MQVSIDHARLSELSRRVLHSAENIAAQRHTGVGLGDLLLALARERRSMCARLLRDLDHHQVEAELVGKENSGANDAASGLASDIDRIVVQAVEQAHQLGSHYTGTEHLLLGITADEQGSRLLRRCNVDPDQLTHQIVIYLQGQH